MTTTTQQLTLASTNLIELTGLQDTTDNSYPLDATVVVTLLDAGNQPVTNATALPMALVAGTSGATSKYRAILPTTVVLTQGADYTARITATTPAGGTRRFDVPCVVAVG